MNMFNYKALPINVHFGQGRAKEAKHILKEYNFASVLIITTPEQEADGQKLAEQLGELCVGVYPKAVMHVPVEVAEQAILEADKLKVDCCLALGGGSTIGLAKAIALKTSIPIVAIPTTYAGSEMTTVYGLTENRLKTTGKDLKVLPKVVIYDPELTLTLPAKISACSGMNAMAHAVEALYAQDKNPIISLMALESIRSLKDALPIIVQDPHNIEAREKATYGAWLAGICLGSVGMAIHHKICHTLGGTYNLPHAEAHAISLAYSVHYNRNADIEAMTQLAQALGGTDHQQVGNLIYELNQKLNIPLALKDIGLPEEGPQTVAKIVCDSPYYNPRAYDYAELEQLMQRAYQGLPPN
ncbi:MAG: maleylacetate reductase [Acinetobacter sp.]|uniref:maleylacetate reductase n=1 Tax=Acinetobacter sp. TaxID=472 RepID=UPI0026DF1BE7|nr:maleylacetate reductase [Acinetobacter sp.]MDO5543577.1 maleylacetate reductase [Acinetobacter sp.]